MPCLDPGPQSAARIKILWVYLKYSIISILTIHSRLQFGKECNHFLFLLYFYPPTVRNAPARVFYPSDMPPLQAPRLYGWDGVSYFSFNNPTEIPPMYPKH